MLLIKINDKQGQIKMKTKIKTILTIIVVIALALLYNYHKDQTRVNYAQVNDCEWVQYASHDICK